MTEICNSAKYGEIVYEESFWSGRLKITVGGKEFTKVTKKIYEYAENDVVYKVEVVGNYFIGVKLLISTSSEPEALPETVKVCDGYKWYEFIAAFLGFGFVIAWNFVPAEIFICFPVMSGAIGGALSSVFGLGGLYFAGKFKKWWQRILIALVGSIVSVLANWMMGMGLLSIYI